VVWLQKTRGKNKGGLSFRELRPHKRKSTMEKKFGELWPERQCFARSKRERTRGELTKDVTAHHIAQIVRVGKEEWRTRKQRGIKDAKGGGEGCSNHKTSYRLRNIILAEKKNAGVRWRGQERARGEGMKGCPGLIIVKECPLESETTKKNIQKG